MCYYYEIDIETVFIEKIDIKRHRKNNYNNRNLESISYHRERLEIEKMDD